MSPTNEEIVFTLEVSNAQSQLVRIMQVFARRNCSVLSLTVQPQSSAEACLIVIKASNILRPEQIRRHLEKLVDIHWARIGDGQLQGSPQAK